MEPKKANDPDELGGWRINGRLGEGGFGTVFLAEKGAQKAAIKVIRQEFVEEDEARKRLAMEAEILSKLFDPSIGKILESDLSGEYPWIATEFINGPTLDRKIKYEGPLKEREWFNLAANIFHAVITANEMGVIHKDIKPSNIILGETGNKLIDFGIAHISGQTRTATFGDREGSTPFSSPEHFTIRANPKMDVFSAAATLAYAAKGASIWNGDNDLQLMRSINEDEPNLLGLSANQKKFIAPLLEKNPSDRPTALEAHQSALVYIEYLLGRKKQPRALKSHNKFKKAISSKKAYALALAVMIFVLALTFKSLPFFKDSSNQLATQCQTSLQNGSLDLAIETCARAVAAGSESAQVLLARAHMAKGSDAEAKLILERCKDQLLTCKSDYVYFFQKGTESLSNLENLYIKGEAAAGWRIGAYYAERKNMSQAISWYEKSSKAKNPIANILLAVYWSSDGQKQYKKAINYAKLAKNGDLTGRPMLLKIDHPVERLIESIYTKSGDSAGKLNFFTKCALEKVAFCISTVANTYLDNKDFENAKKWGLVGAKQQNAKSMWVLARVAAHKNSLLPKGTVDKAIDDEIMKWYKKAAELGDVQSSFSLGFFYAMGIGSLKTDLKESCSWYQKTMADVTERKGTYREEFTDQKDYSDASQFFLLQSCQTILLGENKLFSSPTPTPVASSVKKSVKNSTSNKEITPLATSSSRDTTLAVASSDKFSVGSPLAQNVVKENIDGRVFKDGLNYWRIYLTNTPAEKVPPITGIQFKLIGFSNAEWLNTPYKLKKDSKVGVTNSWDGVYAEVDDLMFAFQFKNMKYCPEFRAIREENGKIVHIWSKGQPECSNDYTP